MRSGLSLARGAVLTGMVLLSIAAETVTTKIVLVKRRHTNIRNTAGALRDPVTVHTIRILKINYCFLEVEPV
jgi:hypothetical protein